MVVRSAVFSQPLRQFFQIGLIHSGHKFGPMDVMDRQNVIFVEDGVKFRNMKRVFKKLFEFFDKSRGQKRMEEIHFLGLPKVRAMIHDLELDMPFESNRYPEPKYELIGRARVLHIFRDRGDQEDLIQVPWDFSWLPAPMKLK